MITNEIARRRDRIAKLWPGIGAFAVHELATALSKTLGNRTDEVLDSVEHRHGDPPFNAEHNLYLLCRYCIVERAE